MKTLYELDFYAWTQSQAYLIQNQKWAELDIINLVEEIEALGRKERQELRSRLGLLLGHLLKWQHQPTQRSNSWLATIREQRREIHILLKESPSLKPYLEEALQISYESAIDLAVRETNLPFETFPTLCPFTIDEIFSSDFLPQ